MVQARQMWGGGLISHPWCGLDVLDMVRQTHKVPVCLSVCLYFVRVNF